MSQAEVGYLGLVEVDGFRYRCLSMNSTPQQSVLPYDHVYGLNDKISGEKTKGEDIGKHMPQTTIWRPSMELIGGSFEFYPDESNVHHLFEYIRTGDYINEINFHYACGRDSGATFRKCRLNSYSFMVSSGEVLRISVGFNSADLEDGRGADQHITPYKLITWDKVDVIAGLPGDIRDFNLNVENEIIPIYTADNDGFSNSEYGPRDLRIGSQKVSGTISTYLKPIEVLMDADTQYEEIDVTVVDSFNFKINAVVTPLQISTSSGVFFAGIAFTGVGLALD